MAERFGPRRRVTSAAELRRGRAQPRMSFAAFLSMAVELADCTRPVSFVAGSTFAFFGLVTLLGGGAAVAKFLAAPARRSHAAGLHGTARVKQGCRASAAGHAGGGGGGAVGGFGPRDAGRDICPALASEI